MKTVQKLRPDPYPDTDDLLPPHLRNQPWLGEVSEEGTFNRAWQVLAPAERTVCRLQCIPSPFHPAPSADFIKVHARTQFVLLNPILSIQLRMSETMTTNCCTASWKSTEPTASCCTQSCLHQTPLKLKCCWSYYTSQQMETMWRASNPLKRKGHRVREINMLYGFNYALWVHNSFALAGYCQNKCQPSIKKAHLKDTN